jgi:outer membrane protein assembly factor BamB
MKRASSSDPDDSFAVEITPLDGPETQEPAPDRLLQGSRLAPRVRRWLTILSVVGGILLVVVVFLPLLSSLLPKKTIASPKPHLPPAQIQNVTVQDGIAYITSSDGTLRALRVKNGSLLWQRHSVSMTPLIINDIMYVEYYNQNNITIQALRTKDASLLWTFKTSLDSEPLIIADGVVYPLFQYSSHGHIIIAVNGSNGIELWHYTMSITQSPGINIQGMQDKIYITTFPNAQAQNTDLFVLGMRDGLLLWHVQAEMVPAIQNNVVAIMAKNGVFKVLRADNGHEIWQYKSPNINGWSPITGTNLFYMQTLKGLLQALSVDTGTVQWTYKDPWGVAEVFPEVNGVLYLETGDGFIVALRTSDGARLWHVRPVAPPFTFGSVQVVGGIVYTFTTIGDTQYETIAALNATDGSLLWRHKIDAYSNNSMQPQISNDLLLADSGNVITALRTHDGTVLWHVNYIPSIAQYTPNPLTFTSNIVIVQSSDSVLEAHQSGTGALLWRYPRGASS